HAEIVVDVLDHVECANEVELFLIWHLARVKLHQFRLRHAAPRQLQALGKELAAGDAQAGISRQRAQNLAAAAADLEEAVARRRQRADELDDQAVARSIPEAAL